MYQTISKGIITSYVVGMFLAVWLGYYNLFAFRSGRFAGGIISVAVYCYVYSCLARLYKAFEIGICQIGEVIFSQLLAIGISDVAAYVECCLIARKYVDVLPGLLTAAFQVADVTVWAVYSKQYLIRHVNASRTLVVYGKEGVEEFVQKLKQKYSHMFAIDELISSGTEKETLYAAIDRHDTVIFYEVEYGVRTGTMEYCLHNHKNLYLTPRITDILFQGFCSSTLVDTPLMQYEYRYLDDRTYRFKRKLDVAVSLLLLVVFAIPMLVAAAAIKIEDGGPVFFRQRRCTRGGRIFEILKFRSMVVDAEKDGAVIPCMDQDSRITRTGRILRRYRIDEMPQIFNVLRGEMSIVGPRPERVEHVREYTKELPEFVYRMRVNGGLTGYAQIFGKYNTSAGDKLKLDLMYIENQSLLLDLKLIMMTLKIMFLPESTEGFQETQSKKIGKWGQKMPDMAGKRLYR